MSDANVDPGVAGAASDPAGAVPASPEKSPTPSPINGQVPPVEHQFKKGKPGGPGRPKGAWPRAAMLRELAKGHESDPDHIGTKADLIGREIVEAALAGDIARVKALAEIVNQAEGKPPEFIEHGGEITTKRVVLS